MYIYVYDFIGKAWKQLQEIESQRCSFMAPSILERGFKYSQNNLLEANMSASKSVKDLQKSLGCKRLRKLAGFTRLGRARASLPKWFIFTRMIVQHSENRTILLWIQFWKLDTVPEIPR